jgi:hypothetical protein
MRFEPAIAVFDGTFGSLQLALQRCGIIGFDLSDRNAIESLHDL